MKKIRAFLSSILLLLILQTANSQLPSLDFLYGYTNDARLILTEYIRPYANIMGANLNGGWYNTAKPHKPGGFDLNLTVSVAFAPTSALSYDMSELALNAQVEGTSSIAPTVAGDMDVRPSLVSSMQVTNPVSGLQETFEVASVIHPNGAGIDFLPLPMAQLSLGLIKGTDVSVRFIPQTRIGEYGRVGVWGVGGKHSISQWIPVLKKLDFINIAVQGGYTKVASLAHIDMQPIAQVDIENPPLFDDQFISMDVSGWTVNLIASQSIPIITVYEGIGYSSSLADIAVLGHFPINTIVTAQGDDFGKTTYVVVEDPIKQGEMTFENYKNLRLNAGIRIKLGVLTLHYDFTKTLYATHTAGIGVTFR